MSFDAVSPRSSNISDEEWGKDDAEDDNDEDDSDKNDETSQDASASVVASIHKSAIKMIDELA
jgi:hypothetical protein